MRALPTGIISTAHYSECRRYRYQLARRWDERSNSVCVFIMLNPSTATEDTDDPTVAKCRRYAVRWGYGGMVILNLFAWRSTDPKVLTSLEDPVGPENDEHIMRVADQLLSEHDRAMIICAWGGEGLLRSRSSKVSETLRQSHDLYCLKINASDGTPAHPLYLKESLDPILYKKRLSP